MTVKPNSAHFVRLRYHGATDYLPSRHVATWEGWAKEDGRPIRRRVPSGADDHATIVNAANAFVAWLSEGGFGTYEIASVSYGRDYNPNERDILILINARRKG